MIIIVRQFLDRIVREADAEAIDLTGSATAVLLGWRESTVDAAPPGASRRGDSVRWDLEGRSSIIGRVHQMENPV